MKGCACSRTHVCRVHRDVMTPRQRPLAGHADRSNRKRRDMSAGIYRAEHSLVAVEGAHE